MGEWSEDKITKGKLTFSDTRWYKGEFKDMNYHGEGEYCDLEGNTYEGEFKAG